MSSTAEEQRKIGDLPRFCAVFALLLSLTVLVAHGIQLPLPTLRAPFFHISPLTMTSELLIALGVLGALSGAPRRATIPLSVAALLLIGTIAGYLLSQPPFAWHLPVQLMTMIGCVSPGHPCLVARSIVFVLSVAALLSVHDGHRTSQLVVLLASLTLGTAFIAGIGVPLALADGTAPSNFHLMSGSAAMGAITLSIGLIGWRHRSGWPHLPWDRHVERTVLGTILALCIVAPVTIALLGRWTVLSAALSWGTAEALQVGAQIVVSTVILFWAWSRISGENIARQEITRALDAAPIALVTMTGEIVHWSEGCERLYQWTAREACGRIKHELLGSAVARRWESLTAGLLPDRSAEEELIEHRRDGTPLFVLEQARLMPGTGERPAMIILSMTDITARTRAEEALRASDARLALAVEALELGLFEWQRDGDALSISAAVADLTDSGEEEATGGLARWRRHLRSKFELETFPDERQILHRQMPRFGFRMHRAGPDGNLLVMQGVVRCVYGPTGKLNRLIGVMFDTSEREQDAAMLLARESELHTILAHVPDAMITVDERGRIRSFSATAEQLLGYASDEVIGRDAKLLIPPRHHAQHDRHLLRYLDTGNPYLDERRHRAAARHRDGYEVPIDLAVGEAEIGHERIFIAFLRDQTEQLAAQARLTELRDELVHVSRLSALGEMAAGLAHELNQPLAAIANFLGAADVLLENDAPANPDRLRTLMRMSSVQVLRAGEIMRRVRNFASRGAVDIQPEPLAEVLSDAVELLLTTAEWHFVRIRFAFDPAYPTILADRVQIQQVIVNLVRNSLEAMAERPEVHPDILLESRGAAKGMVEILVHDNGPGVAPEILQRDHAPFYSTKSDGLGIGLSICRRIIEAHGGTFVMENRRQGGATARFTVPGGDTGFGL